MNRALFIRFRSAFATFRLSFDCLNGIIVLAAMKPIQCGGLLQIHTGARATLAPAVR
jgi:hypothetical protein